MATSPTLPRGCRRWPSRARSWSRRGCSVRSPGCSWRKSVARTRSKGVPEPTALFRLVRASGGGRRSGQRNLTPLVGRDEEIAMLMRRWERARQGEGQLVLIVGEPGLGKSRLIEEFHLRLTRDAAHLERMDLLAASAEHAAASDRRMGPAALRRRRRAGGAAAGGPGKHAGAGQARSGGECFLARAAPRYSAAQGTRIDFGARRVTPPAIGGADQLGDGRRQGAAVGAGVRGFALGRSDHARRVTRHCRARRAGAALHRGDDPARVSPALGHALASRHHLARRRSIAPRCATWWRSCPPATRCRAMWSMTSPRAPAACRCSSRR